MEIQKLNAKKMLEDGSNTVKGGDKFVADNGFTKSTF